MKLSLFGENKTVLLVGEGNFSFAVTLAKQKLNINLTATCYEKDVHETGKKNIDVLKTYGVRVFLDVDATKLEKHKILSLELFDVVVFNFPHVGGKMRIEKNRNLLKNFFVSVKNILKNNGKVFISLCDGQGGTPFDKTNRKWNDSWQITEMAAHGSFNLTGAEPFDSSLFKTYTVTGYRSLEKKFNTNDSITHIFSLVDEPNISNISPKIKINLKKFSNMHVDSEPLKYFLSKIEHSDNLDGNQNILSLCCQTYVFDITFIITSNFYNLKFYEILYNNAGLIIDNVEFIGHYKSNNVKETKTFRIYYQSNRFPLYRKLAVHIHKNLITEIIEKNFNVLVT